VSAARNVVLAENFYQHAERIAKRNQLRFREAPETANIPRKRALDAIFALNSTMHELALKILESSVAGQRFSLTIKRDEDEQNSFKKLQARSSSSSSSSSSSAAASGVHSLPLSSSAVASAGHHLLLPPLSASRSMLLNPSNAPSLSARGVSISRRSQKDSVRPAARSQLLTPKK